MNHKHAKHKAHKHPRPQQQGFCCFCQRHRFMSATRKKRNQSYAKHFDFRIACLKGTCKFGSSCKFDHEVNERTANQSILHQNAPTATAGVDVAALIKSVQSDMTNAEKGGQWLISSYAPFKEKPAFPEFEDRSFEEVRLAFYEASKNGTVEQFKRDFQLLLQSIVVKVKALQNPSQDIVNILKQIYNTPLNPPQKIFVPAATQAQQGTSSWWKSSSGTAGFGNQSIFAGGQNVFAQQQQLPQQQLQQPQQQPQSFSTTNSIFNNAQTSTGSIFAGNFPPQPNQASPFAQPALQVRQTTQPSSIFSPQKPQTTSSIFAPNPGFGTQTSIFSGQQFTTPQSTVPANPFVPATQNNQAFTATQNNQAFTATQNNQAFTGSVFTPQTTGIFSSALQQQGNSIFSGSQVPQTTSFFTTPSSVPTAQPTIFGGAKSIPIDETLYSKMEELSKDEIVAFQNEAFEAGKIPEKPPPVQLCS